MLAALALVALVGLESTPAHPAATVPSWAQTSLPASGESTPLAASARDTRLADAQETLPPEAVVFLAGDAGYARRDLLDALADEAEAARERAPDAAVIVVYLGDNIYEAGLPDPQLDPDGHAEAAERLERLIEVPRDAEVRGIFVPGNHDWAREGPDGWDAIRRQGAYIAAAADEGDQVEMLPAEGCPGPVVVDVAERLRLVALDTQWWLHRGPRPEGPESMCDPSTEDGVVIGLAAAIESAGERHVVLLTHHPPVSGGRHGGTWPVQDWLWPPWSIFESSYRRLGMLDQDMTSSAYRRMVQRLTSAFEAGAPLVWAGGHDHSIQVIEGERAPRWVLISGATSYATHVHGLRTGAFTSRWWEDELGFLRLDFFADGNVMLEAALLDGDDVERPYEVSLTGNGL